MTNREFKFHGALQKAERHTRTFDATRMYSDGREFRAIYDAIMAVAHGIDAACESLTESREQWMTSTRSCLTRGGDDNGVG